MQLLLDIMDLGTIQIIKPVYIRKGHNTIEPMQDFIFFLIYF